MLKYHVVAGSYSSNELPLLPLKTLNGQDVKFTVGSGSVFINGSQVLTADIEASNGVIHVIDKVLIPQNSAAAESAKSIIMRGIRMGVQHFNNGNHSACAEIYEITLRSLLMLPQRELSKASREMVSDSLKQIIMMESPTDKAWEARETFDKLLAINTGDSASGNPTEDTYVTMSIIDDGHMMIKWKGHDSVKLQRSSDFRNWQTIDESKGESKFMMRIGSEIEFFRTVKE